MRTHLLIFLSIAFSKAQHEQYFRLEYSPVRPSYRVSEASITDSNLPLRIETDNIPDDSAVETIHVHTPSRQTNIEVPHPLIMERFRNLRALILQNAGLKRIANNSFDFCENLTEVSFNDNQIIEIKAELFKNCGKLYWMTLVNNAIISIDQDAFLGLANLYWLDLSDNKILSIYSGFLKHTVSLEHLKLAGNPILRIHANSFAPSLVTLELKSCQLTQLIPETFENLTNLVVLNLAMNPITELPTGIFTSLTGLTTLQLQETKIKRLNSNSFGRLLNLQVIYISSSGLDEIQPNFFDDFPIIQQFVATNNLCVNMHLYGVNSTNFIENKVLHQCFANWFISRVTTTTTQTPQSDSGKKLLASLILMINVGLINFV